MHKDTPRQPEHADSPFGTCQEPVNMSGSVPDGPDRRGGRGGAGEWPKRSLAAGGGIAEDPQGSDLLHEELEFHHSAGGGLSAVGQGVGGHAEAGAGGGTGLFTSLDEQVEIGIAVDGHRGDGEDDGLDGTDERKHGLECWAAEEDGSTVGIKYRSRMFRCPKC